MSSSFEWNMARCNRTVRFEDKQKILVAILDQKSRQVKRMIQILVIGNWNDMNVKLDVIKDKSTIQYNKKNYRCLIAGTSKVR